MKHAWIVDLDGTLALRGDRNPYRWDRVGEDEPNIPVVVATQAIAAHPSAPAVILVSGRDESCRRQTIMWLDAHDVPFDELHMRPSGDGRPDDILKEEIYRVAIAGRFAVVGVIDDRRKVVRMWRRLGLVCFQVDDGEF
ncbi:MAG: polynucleotide kinase [Rhodococcus sp. (in: high G+C Gram-positive bacteria)]|uniref:phosphatase domain-containing protein n=1 Tax=Rhodococcus sp. TaxID=1831 RepID=UPI003BB6648D